MASIVRQNRKSFHQRENEAQLPAFIRAKSISLSSSQRNRVQLERVHHKHDGAARPLRGAYQFLLTGPDVLVWFRLQLLPGRSIPSGLNQPDGPNGKSGGGSGGMAGIFLVPTHLFQSHLILPELGRHASGKSLLPRRSALAG